MRSRGLVAVCAAALFLLVGCASIPGETAPQEADLQNGNVSAGIAEPERGIDPLTLVRDFVDSSGDPANLYASARGYLAKSAQTTWNLGSQPSSALIIDDTFSTNYGDEPVVSANLDDVELNTTLIGSLNTDGSFTPATTTTYDVSLQVRKGADGQWRILNPPDKLLITQTDFTRYYRSVSLYFFAQGWNVLVPDQRYVVADPVGLPGRIVQLLLDGPAKPLEDAVLDAIPPDATLKTNVTERANGEIFINLNSAQDLTSNTRQLMIAQIGRSLQNYGSSVAVEVEGVPLVPGHSSWRLADLPSYTPYVGPNAAPLVVAHNRIYNLNNGREIDGPAGDGGYDVVTAAQSADGQELATVTQRSDGSDELRIGPLKSFQPTVNDLTGRSFTRPTWEPSDAGGDPSRGVWTVVDGVVERVTSTPHDGWAASPVDASELQQYGPITDLRLSEDGVRVAVAAGGHLLIGSVVIDQGSAAIKQVQMVPSLMGVTKVDWLRQDQLVVTSSQAGAPVKSVSVDGEKVDSYTSANLTSTVTALAASASGPVLVADASGIWSATDLTEVWSPIPHNQPAGSIPFYPG